MPKKSLTKQTKETHTSATRATVAQMTGLSGSTVSRALSDSPLISDETKEIVRAAAAQIGYIPNTQAALLAKRATRRLGFVIPQYGNTPTFSRSYFPMLLDGAVVAADELGYAVTIILDRTGDNERDLARIVKAREADGLILSILKQGDPKIIQLKEEGIPFVLTSTEETGISCVNNNPVTGIDLAIRHLKELGHHHVGFIKGDMRYQNAEERYAAFLLCAKKHAIKTTIAEGNFSKTSGYYTAGKLLKGAGRPTALLASSDREALGILEYCRDHALQLPRDLSLIGFDNLDPAAYLHPALTTINNPVRAIGMEAARLLIAQIEDTEKKPKIIRLETGLKVRETTGPCPK